MEINSPIGQFLTVLQQAQKSALQYANVLRNNEAATRATLIDPVLKALGWETANPEMVEFERSYQNTRVDYALLDPSGGVQAVIEAKALGVNLSDNQIFSALVKYAYTYQTKEIFLTDGQTWKQYKMNGPGDVESAEIVLSNGPTMDQAEFLIHRLDVAKYWCQPAVAKPVTLQPPPSVTNPLPSVTPPVTVQNTFTPLSALQQNLKGQKAPKLLCLPDGNVVKVKTWADILWQCCQFVLANNLTLKLPMPDKAGKKVSLVSFQKPLHDVSYKNMTYQGQTIYIILNYDSNNCVANARHVLNYLPAGKFVSEAAVSF